MSHVHAVHGCQRLAFFMSSFRCWATGFYARYLACLSFTNRIVVSRTIDEASGAAVLGRQ